MTKEYQLTTPLEEKQVRKLTVGEIVYLNGVVYTARDEAHIHILEEMRRGREVDVQFGGGVIYHCGPIVKRINDGWKVVAAGPTTSSRMNLLEAEFIERTHIKAIIGKGGMSRPVADTMAKYGVVYLAFTGGAAVLAANRIRRVKGVYLERLGMPEAVWVLEVSNFGPLVVGVDVRGNSLYERVNREVEKNLLGVRKKLGLQSQDMRENLGP